jgi:hypothetical protein
MQQYSPNREETNKSGQRAYASALPGDGEGCNPAQNKKFWLDAKPVFNYSY